MYRINIDTKTPYQVIVGENILADTFGEISAVLCGKKVLVVTDEGVPSSLVSSVINGLKCEKKAVYLYTLANGEGSKTPENLFKILAFLADNLFTRRDGIIALGGGMVGDLAGLAAALYMRGVKYVQLPTTLLAGVDSSVGGKTAVDMPQGKNLVGAFYQPALVVADTSVYKTLSKEESLCGMGEVLKYALLARGELLNKILQCSYDDVTGSFIEKTTTGDKPCDMPALVSECVKIKAEIVSADEREGGIRRLLNLGHTVGHAIEKLSGYTIPHGVCVVKGLVKMAEIGNALGIPCYDARRKVLSVAENLGISTDCPYVCADIVKAIRFDKKSSGECVTVVLSCDDGSTMLKDVEFSVLEGLL